MPDERRLVIWRGRDHHGSRLLEAILTEEGGLRIEGQDIGAAVSAAFGADLREYEFDWTADAAEVPRIVAILGGALGGGGDDPLELLHRWVQSNGGRDPGQFLSEAGVRLGFWSRLGD
jgi:hypothetical protein